METLNLKKEKMQAVRFYILLLVMMVCVTNSVVAQTIQGRYTGDANGSLSYLAYQFGQDHRFRSSSGHISSHKPLISQGYYLVMDDTLFLFHDKLDSSYPSSSYKIIEQKPIDKSDGLSLSIQVVDENGKSIAGVSVTCSNGDSLLFGKLTDVEGHASIYTEGRFAKSLRLSYTGTQPLHIDLKEFWGSNYKLKVVLEQELSNRYNEHYRIEKYAILDIGGKEMHLLDANGKKVVLKKS